MTDQTKEPTLEEIEARWVEIQSLFDFPFLEVNVLKTDPECPSTNYVVEAGDFTAEAGAKMFSIGVFRATSDIAAYIHPSDAANSYRKTVFAAAKNGAGSPTNKPWLVDRERNWIEF